MKNFFSLPIALLVFTCVRWRQGVLCVIQSLPHPDFGCVTRFAEWFCVRPSFLFSPSPLPHLKSPLPWPLRKAWYSGYTFIQAIGSIHIWNEPITQWRTGFRNRDAPNVSGKANLRFFLISSRPDFCKLKPRQCYDFNMAADFSELCKNFRCMLYVNVTMRKFLSSRRSQSELRRKQRNGYGNAPTRQSCSFAQKSFFFFQSLYSQGVISSFFSLSPFISYRLIPLIKCRFR